MGGGTVMMCGSAEVLKLVQTLWDEAMAHLAQHQQH